MLKRRFEQGAHVCAFYESPEERDALVAAYVAEGLAWNERCLYGALSAPEVAAARTLLRHLGVEVEVAEARGALTFLTPEATHLVGGRFDAERMLAMLNDATEAALNAGYAGFRTCGDMSWLAEDPPGAEQVTAYEAFLSSMFERQRALGLCLYDKRRLPGHVLEQALATHPRADVAGAVAANPRYDPTRQK